MDCAGGSGQAIVGGCWHWSRVSWGLIMSQLVPQSRVFLAREPADSRRGNDGLAALCRNRLGEDQMAGAIRRLDAKSGWCTAGASD